MTKREVAKTERSRQTGGNDYFPFYTRRMLSGLVVAKENDEFCVPGLVEALDVRVNVEEVAVACWVAWARLERALVLCGVGPQRYGRMSGRDGRAGML